MGSLVSEGRLSAPTSSGLSGLPQESHIGHARNYLAADIIRRVMEDYFGYRVRMVMNVTDVDDKIITKARRAFLLQRYQDSKPDFDKVRRPHRQVSSGGS